MQASTDGKSVEVSCAVKLLNGVVGKMMKSSGTELKGFETSLRERKNASISVEHKLLIASAPKSNGRSWNIGVTLASPMVSKRRQGESDTAVPLTSTVQVDVSI